MIPLRNVVCLAAIAASGLASGPASAELTAPRISPKATVSQTLGMTDVTLVYSRPGVRGRTIWGELVPYGKPWRTGANEATTFTCSTDITVNGQKLPAGTYSFFTIPAQAEWTVVFNKQKDLWGAFTYDSTQDQLRVTARPEPAPYQEWMDFAFQDLAPAELPRSPGSGKLVLHWEKLSVPIAIETDMVERTLAAAHAEMSSLKADDWRTPMRAASFCHDQDVNLVEAMQWAQKSAAIQENYQTLSVVAKLQAKRGRTQDAIATAKKAIKIGKASKDRVDTSATEKLLAEWTAKK